MLCHLLSGMNLLNKYLARNNALESEKRICGKEGNQLTTSYLDALGGGA